MRRKRIKMKALKDITDKLNIQYDLNFEKHILSYRYSLHKYSRRFKELKDAISSFKNGEYGNVRADIIQINQECIEKELGIIRGLYTCYDSGVEIVTYLYHIDGKLEVRTLLYCRLFQYYQE